MLSLLIAYLLVFTPLVAALLWFKKISVKLAHYWACLLFIGAVALILGFYPLNLPKVTNALPFYVWGLCFYVWLFAAKIDLRRFNQLLALALWTVFIAADVWEYGVFFHALAGNPGHARWLGQWSDHIHRFYVLITTILMGRLAKLQLNAKTTVLALAAFLASPLLLCLPGGGIYARITAVFLIGLAVFLSMP